MVSEAGPGRVRTVLRWGLRIVLGGLALVGLVSVVAARPAVGQWRSVEGGRIYQDAYARALASMPTPTRTVDVGTDYGTARAYLWGSPETSGQTPVLLLPGRTSGVPMWSLNLPTLAAHHPVIAVDAIGDAGRSVQTVPFIAVDDQALWLDQVVAELAPAGVHLVGHSFGGATAATYARRHPERVRSLVLLEPVFTFARPSARMMGWAVLGSLPWLPGPVRDRALAEIGGGERADPDDPVAQMITAGADHYAARLPTPQVLTDEQLRSFPMPVYVALADHDSLAGAAAVERARRLPDATVRVWPDTTHSLPMQVAEPLAEELHRFWRR